MNRKLAARARRAKKTRARINEGNRPKLTVVRSNRHIRAQIIRIENHQHRVVAEVNSLDKDLRASFAGKSKVDIAKSIGEKAAGLAKEQGITKLACDRSGYKYHGRVKALVESLRENGIEI